MSLGIHMLTGEHLLELLHRVASGADPEIVYIEMYVNAAHVKFVDGNDEEGEDE